MSDPTRYREWAPPAELRREVACLWEARFGDDGEAHVDRVIPDGCIDLLWVAGRVIIAGPDTTSQPMPPPPPGLHLVGLRFRPGVAPAVLGMPACELLDARVDAEEVLGDRAKRLRDALVAAPAALAAHVGEWLRAAEPHDRMVVRATERLRWPGALRGLAAELGVSDRQLRRRFVDAVGYRPKLFERVQRLRRFVALAAEPNARRLAELATAAGYADQPHLTRDVGELAGCTPAELVGYPVTAT